MAALSLSAAPAGTLSAQNETLCGPPLLLWNVTTSPALMVSSDGLKLYLLPSSSIVTSWFAPPPPASGAAAGAPAGCSGAAVVVSFAAFFSPPQAARRKASPATMDVTRIAAHASETGRFCNLVNPFTRPQKY